MAITKVKRLLIVSMPKIDIFLIFVSYIPG